MSPYLCDACSIRSIIGREILDSRGTPTVEVDVQLENGIVGRASSPSGASVGLYEMVERRDHHAPRHHGKGVREVVRDINREIHECLRGASARDQPSIDHMLRQLDGTPNQSRLGANALLATSLAVMRAAALSCQLPLYRYVGGIRATLMPTPMMNLLNGGKHADHALDIQECMIMPVRASSIQEAIQIGAEIFHTLASQLKRRGFHTHVGDEGGFAPPITETEMAMDMLSEACLQAGYTPGRDVFFALDVAGNELYQPESSTYHFRSMGQSFDVDQLIDYYTGLLDQYPILSIEDPMAEDDFEGWRSITQALGHRVQLVGDDVFVTHTGRLEHGIQTHMANAILIKPNQIGTITDMLHTVELAQRAGYRAILSHRSGETEDTTIAHLAVACQVGQIKTGSLARTDRTCKYNELLRIEETLGNSARYAGILPFKGLEAAQHVVAGLPDTDAAEASLAVEPILPFPSGDI